MRADTLGVGITSIYHITLTPILSLETSKLEASLVPEIIFLIYKTHFICLFKTSLSQSDRKISYVCLF
jgi:hypothetical protein